MNTSQASASTLDTAAADAFLREALHALPVCFDHCECGDHWHAVWAGLKATGMQRTLHSQTDFLTTLLKPYTVPGGLVMIAGAADTGSLEVLHTAIADVGQRYCVIDRCEAPLQLVRQRAAELAMSLHAQHGTLETVRATQPWDMVFIHYTLSFMDRAARLQFIHHLRQDLAPRGVVVCAVRQTQPDAHSTPAEQLARWTQTSAARLRRPSPAMASCWRGCSCGCRLMRRCASNGSRACRRSSSCWTSFSPPASSCWNRTWTPGKRRQAQRGRRPRMAPPPGSTSWHSTVIEREDASS